MLDPDHRLRVMPNLGPGCGILMDLYYGQLVMPGPGYRVRLGLDPHYPLALAAGQDPREAAAAAHARGGAAAGAVPFQAGGGLRPRAAKGEGCSSLRAAAAGRAERR